AEPFFFQRGDANHDRVTNALDFNALAANFGLAGRNYSQGNFDYSGVVNTNDFIILAAAFNNTLPVPASPLVVESFGAPATIPAGILFARERIPDPEALTSVLL